ncbi:MAG: hypothetical protein ACLFPR_14425 [Desulfococcaceae bacterium]
MSHAQAVKGRVVDCLSRIRRDSAPLILLSPLAEGVDRLVAEILLNSFSPSSELRVLLPFSQPAYEKTFHDPAAILPFRNLLQRARSVETMPPVPNSVPEDAFLACGKAVVDRTDILLAIWDGRPAKGRGGTGEVVAYARKIGKPLAWIFSDPPFSLRFENLKFPLEAK